MKKNKLFLLVVPSLFLFSCSRPVIVDEIDVKEAVNFINTKYESAEYKKPSFENTTVSWKIVNYIDGGKAAEHIGRYLSNPKNPTPVEEEKGSRKKITDTTRIEAFKTELENLEPDSKKLGEPGYEAVLVLNPKTYEALYHGQGEEDYELKYKYNGSGASRGLKITSQYRDLNSIFRRVHTYNKDGHETKFELTVNNGKDLNYSLTINFKY